MKRVLKFLVQVEFGETTRFMDEYDEKWLAARIEVAAEHQARLITLGPEPRVTVIQEEVESRGSSVEGQRE
jgi:hypothetical protein